jgi:hypothetical protein
MGGEGKGKVNVIPNVIVKLTSELHSPAGNKFTKVQKCNTLEA